MGIDILATKNGQQLFNIADKENGGLDYEIPIEFRHIQKEFNDLYVKLFDKYSESGDFGFEPEFYLKLGGLDYKTSINCFCLILGIKEYDHTTVFSEKEFRKMFKMKNFYKNKTEDFDEYTLEAVIGFCKICKRHNLGIDFS